jgi:hypothetical protein
LLKIAFFGKNCPPANFLKDEPPIHICEKTAGTIHGHAPVTPGFSPGGLWVGIKGGLWTGVKGGLWVKTGVVRRGRLWGMYDVGQKADKLRINSRKVGCLEQHIYFWEKIFFKFVNLFFCRFF